MESLIGSFAISVVVILVVFLVSRELFCWYAKINERLEILKKIDASLRQLLTMANETRADSTVEEVSKKAYEAMHPERKQDSTVEEGSRKVYEAMHPERKSE